MPVDAPSTDALRRSIAPMFDEALSWTGLSEALRTRGYAVALREDHLVVLDRKGRMLCTAEDLGAPLTRLSRRLGPPLAGLAGNAYAPCRTVTRSG
ncbi:hypothetical protein C8N44_10321 [Allosediminivita pacifica]|uniref:Uncharacterized protein n=2 Tax=Allosediminivita pacifica TaxID=1267769 RepID=A0A2T6B5D4_9RHOB|nr:hypothetical protein C8N44_10321 [Allosediminivita pacifica]